VLFGAGEAVNGGGKGGVHEGFSHFFGNEAEVECFHEDGGADADEDEEELPNRPGVAGDEGEDVFVGAGAEECDEAEEGEEGVDADADGRAVGDFFPFQIILGRAAVKEVAAAAPEQDAAAVDFSEEEEEDDGGTKQVEVFLLFCGDAKEDAEHEEDELCVFDGAVFVPPRVRRVCDEQGADGEHE